MVDKPETVVETAGLPAVAPAEVAPTAPAQPAVTDAAAPPVTPEPVKAVEPERTPTLLEKFDAEKPKPEAKPAEKPAEAAKAADAAKPAEPAKDAAKPAEAKAAEAPKPAEGKPAEAAKPVEAAKPEPVEYKYTLPETLKLDAPRKAETHAAFDSFRADPTNPQPLIDLHNKAMTEFAEQTRRNQFETFNKTKEGWEKDWLADPEIGGAGHRTALKAIARARDLGVSSAAVGTPQYEADMSAFNQFLAITGAGSHPAFAKLLHNLSRFVSEPQAEDIPADIKPSKTNGKAPKSSLYTHASSANMDAK